MPDPRFFEDLGPVSLSDLAGAAGVTMSAVEAARRMIALAAPLGAAGADAVSFLADKRYAEGAEGTSAGACFVSEALANRLPDGCLALITPRPQAAWAAAAARLHRPRRHGGQETAIHPSASLGADVMVGRGAVIGPNAEVGQGCEIGPNAVLGPGVRLGAGCHIGSNATVGFAILGARVRVGAGVVVGESGFGVAEGGAGAVDVPQLGRVIIEDDVSIGACSCIDRGAYDDTVIGAGSKIDNLVQVAHNCRLGRNVVLAGHVGLSGSVTVGDGVQMGGSVGIADHVSVGAGARLAARSGLMRDVPPGEVWGGAPAKPLRQWMREAAWLARMAAGRGESGP